MTEVSAGAGASEGARVHAELVVVVDTRLKGLDRHLIGGNDRVHQQFPVFFRLALAISSGDKIVPIFELIHGFVVCCWLHKGRSDLGNASIMSARRRRYNGILGNGGR